MIGRYALLAIAVLGCRKEPAAPTGPVSAAEPPAAPATKEQLARGEYVATISGCVVCHTPMTAGVADKDRLLAGGVEEKTPSGGTWRSPNITPDRETGIGAWSDAELIAAIRTGVRRDGVKLLPIMPYPSYHRMTDDDARAVVAFLRAQKPVANKVGKSEGVNMRPVDLPPPTNNIDQADDPKAHGEYLASLMHCGACHTPHDGANAGKPFAGGVPFLLPDGRKILASNITSDAQTGIGGWTEDQIAASLRTMKTPKGEPIEGPMAMYKDAWSTLTDGDLRAVAVYVKSIPPVRNEIPHEHSTVSSTP